MLKVSTLFLFSFSFLFFLLFFFLVLDYTYTGHRISKIRKIHRKRVFTLHTNKSWIYVSSKSKAQVLCLSTCSIKLGVKAVTTPYPVPWTVLSLEPL